MKLLYAGQGMTAKPYTQLLFNCTRNQSCQRTFFVPVNEFSDVVMYADLPGKPTLVEIEVMNVCDIGNVGTAVSDTYVIGQTNEGSWYAVLGNPIVTPPVGVTYNRFFFRVTFTIGGIEHIYYSQQYEFPYCEELTFLRGCYPNETVGTDAFDCNGIYYGFPNNEDFLGDGNYRYIHSGFVRMASVIEQRNRMSFTAFNNKRQYKNTFVREYLLEMEFVPTFYKDVLIGIMNRGNVQVDGTEYKLADTQDVGIIDVDSKLWKLDILFDSECKQTFGCKPADCVLPEPPCVGNPTELTYEVVEGIHQFELTGGTFTPGEVIEWEIRNQETDELIDSGTITDEPLFWTVPGEDLDPETTCYRVRWRKRCSPTSVSNYIFSDIGNCEESPCEEAGFPEGTIYAAIVWSTSEEDATTSEDCEGNPVSLPGLNRAAWLVFFSDGGLTTPIITNLNNYPIIVNSNPYLIGNGTPAFAYFIDMFPYTRTVFVGPGCDTENEDQPLPIFEGDDCANSVPEGQALEGGEFTLERGAGDGTTYGYYADMRESVTDPGPYSGASPSAAIGVGSPGPQTTSYFAAFSRITIGVDLPAAPGPTRTVTIVGKANDGTTGEVIMTDFTINPVTSTKKYYIDSNNPITVTVDEP